MRLFVLFVLVKFYCKKKKIKKFKITPDNLIHYTTSVIYEKVKTKDFKGNAQFVQKVIFEPSMDFK